MTQTSIPAATIYTINDDIVTLISATYARVSSKSCPGTTHLVSEHRCDCKGFAFRNRCRHLDAVREARQLANPPLAVVIPDPLAPDDPGRFAILWDGHQYGGTFFHREDAEGRAAELNAESVWGLMGWRSLHAPVRTHTVNGVEIPKGFER